MIEHERFQLPIEGSPPERALEESVANQDRALFGIVSAGCTFSGIVPVIARTPNDAARVQLNNRKGSPRCNCAVKELLKYGPSIPIRFRVLFPDQWVAGSSKQCIKVGQP